MDTNNRTWIGVAGVLAVVVVVVLGWLTLNSSDSNAAAPSDDPPAVEADTTGERGNGCPEQPVSSDIPTEPPDFDWESVNRNLVPVSDEHGPAIIEGDIARCYSRTPEGALIAAVQTFGRLGFVEDTLGVFDTVIEPSEAATAAREEYESMLDDLPFDGDFFQIDGYSYVDYDPTAAVFDLAVRRTDPGVRVAGTFRAVWDNGDWRIELSHDGQIMSPVYPLDDMENFIVWGGA